MTMTRRSSRGAGHATTRLASSLAAMVATISIATACTGTTTADSTACGGHGTLHGDHCHCELGYALSGDGLECVVADATGGGDAGEESGDAGSSGAGETDAFGTDAGGTDAGRAPGATPLAFSPTIVRAAVGSDADGSKLWQLEAVDGEAYLVMENYAAQGGPIAPGVVELTDAHSSYASCSTCLILQTGCTAHDDHFHCQHTFMPLAGGKVQFDAIGAASGAQMAGKLLDVTFFEVTIGSNYQTIPVSDGQQLHLDAWSFAVALDAMAGAELPCSGHGHLHGSACHCDPGYKTDPMDETKCIPQ